MQCCGNIMECSDVLVDVSAICVTKCVRDLAVLVDSALKFSEHIYIIKISKFDFLSVSRE